MLPVEMSRLPALELMAELVVAGDLFRERPVVLDDELPSGRRG